MTTRQPMDDFDVPSTSPAAADWPHLLAALPPARHDVHQWAGEDLDYCIVCGVDWSDADLTCVTPSANRYDCQRLGCTYWVIGSSPITAQEIVEHDRKAHS